LRKFFLALSILILIALLSAGIHQKLNKVENISAEVQETSFLYNGIIS